MSKKLKIWVISLFSIFLAASWIFLFITDNQNQPVNNWWHGLLSIFAITGGIFGMMNAKHWSWLKSKVGRGVFFLSICLIFWGLGHFFWIYSEVFYANQEMPITPLVILIDFFSIVSLPLIIYGMILISSVTGAKYALRKPSAKLYVVLWSALMIAITGYFLFFVSEQAVEYLNNNGFWQIFYYFGFNVLDSINLIIALSIVGLSWKMLGGKFKLPIIALALGFIFLYFADFAFSYFNIRGTYYNGHWSDLLHILPLFFFSLAVSYLDPDRKKLTPIKPVKYTSDSSTGIFAPPDF